MSLLDDVSIVVTPNGYKAGELYAVIPVPTEGAEQVVNGDFATDTDWTIGGTTFSAGAILLDDANDNVFQGWTDTVNTLYKLTITKTGLGTLRFRSGFAGSAATKIEIPESGIIYFTSTSDTNRIQIYGDENSINATLNSVSVKEYTSADMDVTRATAATRVDENGLVNYAEIVGSELAICGDFECASPLTGWTVNSDGAISIDSGKLKVLNVTNRGRSYRTYTGLTIGKTYEAFVGNISGDVGGYCHITSGTANNNITLNATFFFVAGATTADFQCGVNSTVVDRFTFFDNISLKQNDRDNVPRIDYTGGGCPHILAEPQRTNLVTYSSDFTDSSWNSDSSNVHITRVANAATSPSGENNATKLIGNNTTRNPSNAYIFATTSSGTPFVSSVFAKKGEYDYLIMSIGAYAGGYWSSFNLDNGTVDTQPTQSDTTASIEDYGNGWYRCIITTTTAASSEICLLTPCVDGNLTTQYINTTNGIYVYGAQLEEGSYATSYIPTSGSTVTRNQDIFTRDGISSLINSTEGVLFVEVAMLSDDLTNRFFSISNGSKTERVLLGYSNVSNKIFAFSYVGNVLQCNISFVLPNMLDYNKIALKYKLNDFALWVNGVEVGTDLVGSVSTSNTINKLGFDEGDGTDLMFSKVKQLQVYKTALTDNQLIQLTGEAGTHFFESYAEMALALTYTIQ